jgi:SAM-dependent methyltransferase
MTRHLSATDANQLSAGDDHYRAYVGPPGRYGLLGLLQMNLLTALGLEETDTVLDFGCGSLRLGRCLIPFLLRGKYYGIEPHDWLIQDGFTHETGGQLRTLKAPLFSNDDTFDCSVFDVEFDFIMAQSIITHSGPKQTANLIRTAAQSLKQDGLFLFSFILGEDDTPLPEADWTYPFNVPYPKPWLDQQCADNGMVMKLINRHHPGAQWAAIARDPRRLEALDDQLGLAGKPAKRWRA